MPADPVRPNRQRDILTGALLGLFLAVGFAFFLEYLDNTLKTPEDIRTHLGAPLLGVVPETGQAPGGLLIQTRQRSEHVHRGVPRGSHRAQLLLARTRPRASSS